MNTVLKKQILGALCWEQKDSFKDLLLNLVYRIFLFLGPSRVFSIIRFPNVFIFARIKCCSILRRTVPSAVVPGLFWVKHYLRKLALTFLSPDVSQCPPILTGTPPGASSLLPPSQDCCSSSAVACAAAPTAFLLDLTSAVAAHGRASESQW